MQRKILVLFETLTIKKGIIHYSIGLAKRTDAELMLLALLRPDSMKRSDLKDPIRGVVDLEKAGREVLRSYTAIIEREGVRVSSEVYVGDPHSEFLKFLAKNPPFQTIIWGGTDTKAGKFSKMEGHWLVRVKDIINCPLVVPTLKSSQH